MRVALIYNRNQRVALGERCKRILDSWSGFEISQFNLKEIRQIRGGFDLYLRMDDGDYTEDVPIGLKPVGWWVADTHLPKSYKKIKEKVKRYDFVFCAQKEGVNRLQKETGKKIYWIPWAADEIPSEFTPLEDERRKWDICFIGTAGKYSLRRVVLEVIRLHYENIFIGKVPYTELTNYYSKARIVINYSINNDVNARIFEAIGAGALLITHHIKNNGFDELFIPGKHLVVFDDILEEMKEKIDYYLKNQFERMRIVEEGFQYVRSCHTYRHRIQKIFTIMGYEKIVK